MDWAIESLNREGSNGSGGVTSEVANFLSFSIMIFLIFSISVKDFLNIVFFQKSQVMF